MRIKYNLLDHYIQSQDIASARKMRIAIRKFVFLFKIILVISLSITFVYFYYFDKNEIIKNKFENYIERFCFKTNMRLNTIVLDGEHYSKKSDLLSAIGVKKGDAILNIDLTEALSNLKALDWVKTASIYRKLPDSLYIKITEKKPIAIWQNSQKLYLIDEDGQLIKEQNLKPFSKMMIVIGDDAPLHTNNLINILQADNSLFKKITSAIRISERRWNVRLIQDIEIKLPEENIKEAWDYVIKLYKSDALFNKGISTLDLRVQKKLYLNYKNSNNNHDKKKSL